MNPLDARFLVDPKSLMVGMLCGWAVANVMMTIIIFLPRVRKEGKQ